MFYYNSTDSWNALTGLPLGSLLEFLEYILNKNMSEPFDRQTHAEIVFGTKDVAAGHFKCVNLKNISLHTPKDEFTNHAPPC
jgi:hypothetical protein